MFEYKDLRKITTIFVIAALIFNIQMISLHSQEDDWEKQFNKAKEAYKNEKYTGLNEKIKWIIDNIPERIELLGKCYLLLGAVYEKQGESQKARENYLKARDEYGILYIDGIDLENLPLYQKVLKEKTGQEKEKVIAKEGGKNKKKKFPVLLVAAGAAVVVAIILLTQKKKEKQYTLTVNLGEGVEGTPSTGTTAYKEGTTISYNYTLKPGYNNLVVQLDNAAVSSSGTTTMNQNHTLTASAGTNAVTFVTSQDTVQVPEGGTASFNVRLSAQPTANVNVTVARESGDTDITVITGGTLTFTTTNWNTDQAVTLQAAQDADTTDGQATIAIAAPGTGIPQKTITATEQDDDVEEVVTVQIVKPANGAEVTRGIRLEIEASAGSSRGIARVEFLVDNRLIASDINSPYTVSWDTTTYLEGSHSIRADAYSNTGKKASAQVIVTISALPE